MFCLWRNLTFLALLKVREILLYSLIFVISIDRSADAFGQSINHSSSERDPSGLFSNKSSPQILSAVRFWELVFGGFSPSHCIIHDREDLGIIYAAKRLLRPTIAEQAIETQRYIKAVENTLHELANGQNPNHRLAQRIRDIIPTAQRTPQFLRHAASNVRCQRGVDLKPAIERGIQYIPMIRRQLAQGGMPQDLAFLPFLESGFDSTASSRAGARGLWQLMPETARALGLRVDRWRDQRLDPVISTQAALGLLRQLYQKFASWPLAITAYNYGSNGLERAVRKFGPNFEIIREQHQTRIFGFAAKNYYPSFVAVRNVVMQQAPLVLTQPQSQAKPKGLAKGRKSAYKARL